jgi:NAD(P) transhydrogenase subunit alpha
MDPASLADHAKDLAKGASALSQQATELAAQAAAVAHVPAGHEHPPFIFLFTVFVLACFIGYYVVWRVTPALHSPLMAVTNAISSVIIVGALIAAGTAAFDFSQIMGVVAVALASVNIFGGFIVTQRMLSMFRAKNAKK